MNLFRKNAMTNKKEKEKELKYEDPPDGGWGWMVVVHCFLVRPPQLFITPHLEKRQIFSSKAQWSFPTDVINCEYIVCNDVVSSEKIKLSSHLKIIVIYYLFQGILSSIKKTSKPKKIN